MNEGVERVDDVVTRMMANSRRPQMEHVFDVGRRSVQTRRRVLRETIIKADVDGESLAGLLAYPESSLQLSGNSLMVEVQVGGCSWDISNLTLV